MLPANLRDRARSRARRAWRELVIVLVLVGAVLFAYAARRQLFGIDLPVRIAAGLALAILGWVAARAAGRVANPILARRGVQITGPVSFVVRLVAIGLAIALAFGVVGVDPTAVAAGGAMTAIIVGLAAQQTLGNLFAGIVLLSARPFKVAERVRLQGGPLGGVVEGVITDLGLLYTTLARGEDKILVPNSLVLNSAVVPLREPGGVDVRARVQPEVKPTELQLMLEEAIETPVRSAPQIHLEEVDPEEVVLRVTAIPAVEADGPRLADEVLTALRDATVELRDDGAR
jgi:small-conductance mechanosensitive channel